MRHHVTDQTTEAYQRRQAKQRQAESYRLAAARRYGVGIAAIMDVHPAIDGSGAWVTLMAWVSAGDVRQGKERRQLGRNGNERRRKVAP
jgi:hypothetical protein